MSKYLFLMIAPIVLALAGCAPKAAQAVAAPHNASTEREVTFTGVGGFQLKGTLEIPSGEGKHPALLLLPGSGPSDRNGNQAGLQINILKDIADALAKQGVASLRFDKRAVGPVYGAKFPPQDMWPDFFSWDAFVGDAEAALLFLRTQPEIAGANCGVLGHSEGGTIALALAGRAAPKALVLVSTPARDLGTLIIEQIGTGYSAQFRPKETTAELVKGATEAVTSLRTTGKNPAKLQPDLSSLFPVYLEKYFHSVFTFQPVDAAKQFHGPALVVQGEKDVQVSPVKDGPVLYAAFPKGSAELFVVPNSTHCLKPYKGSQDPGFSGPTDAGALNKIANWSAAHLK